MLSFFRKILQWSPSQKYLYIIYVLFELVPNVLLIATEKAPLNFHIASIFIPLAGAMIIYSLFKKPGIARWILFIKFLIDGFQLVLLYLFGSSIIAADMFLNIFTSTPTEAGELLGNIWFPILLLFIVYTPLFFWAVRSIQKKEILSLEFRKKQIIAAVFIFIIGLGIALIPNSKHRKFQMQKDIYPINIFYNQVFAIKKWNKIQAYEKNVANFTFDAHKSEQSDKREIVVVVLGETSRAINWQLYGADLPTNPHLTKTEGLVHFTDVITQSNTTNKSVPVILSSGSAENFEIIYQQKSVISAFKEAGYKTVALANQHFSNSFLDVFYREPDTCINYNHVEGGIVLKAKPDGCALPDIKKFINSTDENLFIIVHTYGSHFNYHERYPREFAHFTPDKVDAINQRNKEPMINAYNNSIIYTDYLLSEMINMLQEDNTCSTLLYLSDHGEDLLDDARGRYLHSSPTPTFYQLYVPYFIWFSDKYQEDYPDKRGYALKNREKPISTNSVFHTLLDIAHIETPYRNDSLSVVGPDFKTGIRYYVDDYDKPVEFTKTGLKKYDFDMFDKWNIKYTKELQ